MSSNTHTQVSTPAPSEGRGGCAWVGTFLPCYDRNGELKTVALVDRADYDALAEYRWHPNKDGYLYRNLSHKTEGKGHIALHRQIMGLGFGDPREVDHINRNKRDNRSCNMRITDSSGNKQNKGLRCDNTSGFKGVSYFAQYPDIQMDRRWRARVYLSGKEKSLGYFKTAEEANDAAVAARAKHYACATQDDLRGGDKWKL